MIQLAVEIPPALHLLHEHTDFDFVIASHCLHFPAYYDMYKRLRFTSIGTRTLMLDNGAFEQGIPVDATAYLGVIKELRPDVIVLPDVVNDTDATVKVTETFLNHHLNQVGEVLKGAFTLMGVLQGTSPNEYLSMLDYYSQRSPDITMIGIPYHLFYRPKLIKKYRIDQICRERNLDIHILGLPNPFEMVDLAKLSRIVSMDTSLPVVSAYAGRLFRKLQWLSDRLHIDAEHSDSAMLVAISNIELLKAMCLQRDGAEFTLQFHFNNV